MDAPQGDPAEVVGRRIGAALVDAAVLLLLFVVLGLLIGTPGAAAAEGR